jgi:hypothetical protein
MKTYLSVLLAWFALLSIGVACEKLVFDIDRKLINKELVDYTVIIKFESLVAGKYVPSSGRPSYRWLSADKKLGRYEIEVSKVGVFDRLAFYLKLDDREVASCKLTKVQINCGDPIVIK